MPRPSSLCNVEVRLTRVDVQHGLRPVLRVGQRIFPSKDGHNVISNGGLVHERGVDQLSVGTYRIGRFSKGTILTVNVREGYARGCGHARTRSSYGSVCLRRWLR